jgi:beta-lactamase regulating signal transducer with metallopeptidase domain
MNQIKIELKWAIIFSIVGLLWMVLEKLSGLHGRYIDYHMYLTNLFAIPAIIIMVMALREKKRRYYGGVMNYKQGVMSGIILSAFIALFSPLTQWITTYIISPEYFPNVIERSVELGHFKTREAAEANFNYKSYAIQGAFGSFVMGVITTVIAMIFIRSKNSRETETY